MVGYLRGYRLDFTYYSSGWGGGVGDIVQDLFSEVWGLVYEIPSDDLERLDYYEGYPDVYTRFQVAIEGAARSIGGVWVYSVVNKQSFVPPTRDYLRIIQRAAEEFRFPESYRRLIAKIGTRPES